LNFYSATDEIVRTKADMKIRAVRVKKCIFNPCFICG
jgi:hypothetical protein